ncbi:Hypothetical predicted protein [Mytilus galloprovincialis]|uniref:Uncharacterized protein n=1 Tax=Mytilus galloprovincialis TaxID=29158 RepID=A0A8B6DKQ0_MYTGA|nr:Hypothetical predicted protein [Mytilus galloprovincialis]
MDERKQFWFMATDKPFEWTKNQDFKELESMTDVTLGKDAKIWAISPEKGVVSWDQSKHWEISSSTSGVKFQKIYANPWNDQVWAVDAVGNVYFRESENKPAWKKEKKGPKVQMLATIDNGVVGLDMSNDLWYRKFPNYQGNSGNWEKLDELSDILSKTRVADTSNAMEFS